MGEIQLVQDINASSKLPQFYWASNSKFIISMVMSSTFFRWHIHKVKFYNQIVVT